MRQVKRIGSAPLSAAIAMLLAGIAAADEIRLRDGTKIRGTVTDRDATHLLLQIPREEVAAVNGKSLPVPPAEGQAAPAFEVSDLSGARQAMPDLAGRATLLKFWASWCPYCRGDVALMKELHARYGQKGLRILAVSTDQDPAKLETFVQEQQLPYPVVASILQNAKGDDLLPAKYEISGIPAYYVIDPNGRIMKILHGAATPKGDELERAVTAALQVTRKKTR